MIMARGIGSPQGFPKRHKVLMLAGGGGGAADSLPWASEVLI